MPTIAQYIGNALGGEGKVAVLGSNSIYTLLQRTTILESVLAFEFPDIEVVRWEDFDFTPDGAAQIATAGLQADPEIGAIFAHWDVPASGAIQAVDELGRDDVIITSFTGDNTTGYQYLRDGMIDATVGQSNAQVGMIACEYLALALAGESLPEDTLVPTGFVTDANIPGPEGVFNGRPVRAQPGRVPSRRERASLRAANRYHGAERDRCTIERAGSRHRSGDGAPMSERSPPRRGGGRRSTPAASGRGCLSSSSAARDASTSPRSAATRSSPWPTGG